MSGGNEGKTKYIFSTSRHVRRIDSRITADNYTFDTVKEFVTLAPLLPPKMMSVWRTNAGIHLPTAAAMVSMGN